MFRVIGGVVVYGLALYGLVKVYVRPKKAMGIGTAQDDKNVGATPTGVVARHHDGQSADEKGETSSRAFTSADAS